MTYRRSAFPECTKVLFSNHGIECCQHSSIARCCSVGGRQRRDNGSFNILDLFLTETVLLTGSRRQPGLGHFWERGREFAFSSSPSPMAGRATWNKYHSLRQRGRPPSCLSLVSFGEPWFKRLFYFSLSDDDYHSFDMNPWSRSQKWAK